MTIKWSEKDVTKAYEEALGGQNGKKPMLQGLADRIKQLAGMNREVKLR